MRRIAGARRKHEMAILGTELRLEDAMAPPLAQFRHCVGAPLAKSLEKLEPPFPEKRESGKLDWKEKGKVKCLIRNAN